MSATPGYATSRAAPSLRQKLASFWRWWWAEISALIPERFAAMRGGGAHSPLVALEAGELVLLEARGMAAANEKVAIASLDEPQRRAAARALLERASETRGRARIALAPGEALVRRATMPAATEENLAQVLAFEMDRLTPFKSGEVYFDYRVVSRNSATGQIVVQMAVARREIVDERLASLRALGISPQGVAVRDDAGTGNASFNLLPQGQPGERDTSGEGMLQYALVALVVLLLVIALVLPAWQRRQAIIELHPVLGKAKQEAEATAAVEREVERRVADHNFLTAKKLGSYPALAIVEEVTRLLPDNTWVTQLEVKAAGKVREVTITGEAPSSSKLIEVLEQSALMKNAAPRGTVVRGATPNIERFVIVAELRTRPAPDGRPVAETAPAPAAAPPAAAPPAAPAK
jgi:general secretion pathway protein L